MAGELVVCGGRVPVGEVDDGAVLEGMLDGVQHVGFHPERVTGHADPHTHTGVGGQRCFGHAGGDRRAWRVRIGGVVAGQSGQRVALQASAVAIIEAEPQREVLHSVVVDVDPELVERFRVKAGGGNVTGD